MPNSSPASTRRFVGLDRLYGAGALSAAAQAHVCVVGIGGVGSWAVEALARSGVGRLTLIDLDHIAESNINRQIHALDNTLGAAKVQAMAQRIAQINPACIVHCVEDFISEENIARLIPQCDGVIDAIDNVRAKAALIAHCRHAGIRLITTGGAGGRLDPTRIEIVDLSRTVQDVLAAKVRSKLRQDYGFPRNLKKKFGVDCVYSPEQIQFPRRAIDSASSRTTSASAVRSFGNFCEVDPPVNGGAGIACAGYGSSVAVTAGFGFAAAARILTDILAAP